MTEVADKIATGRDQIPPVLFYLKTRGDINVIPTSYNFTTRQVTGFLDEYNVSGDHPAPQYTWNIVDGTCSSGKEEHRLEENNGINFARRLPIL